VRSNLSGLPGILFVELQHRKLQRVNARRILLYPVSRRSSCASTRAALFSSLSKGEGTGMSSDRMDLPQGTLDLLILKAVALGPQHGWAISQRLHQISSATLQIRQGSLYPALHRIERRGWIKARWSTSENNRRAKYYELTRRGREQLETQTEAWRKLTTTIGRVLEAS
jgi:PadR family transcriptional regulator, regulatory protein PadR